ncbi:hypothetical protein [Fusibacter bizertensis]
MKSYIEIKKNATGQYYFIFRNVRQFVAVSKSFETRNTLNKYLDLFKTNAKTAHVYEGESQDDFPIFQVFNIGLNNYRFQYLPEKSSPLLQSDLFDNRKLCLRFLNELKEQIQTATILDIQ